MNDPIELKPRRHYYQDGLVVVVNLEDLPRPPILDARGDQPTLRVFGRTYRAASTSWCRGSSLLTIALSEPKESSRLGDPCHWCGEPLVTWAREIDLLSSWDSRAPVGIVERPCSQRLECPRGHRCYNIGYLDGPADDTYQEVALDQERWPWVGV